MEKDLQNGWAKVVLEDLYSHVTGGDWGLDPQTEGVEGFSKVVCIRGGELRNWRVNKGNTASIRLVKDSSINTRRLKIGDILLEISGGGPDQPVGRTVIIDEDVFKNHPELPKVCTNFLRLVRLIDIVNKEYINQYLQYFYTSGEVVKYQGGSNTLRNLKFGDYSSIKIPLPPLPEQQRIVAKLDTLFGHLDVLKTRLDRIPQLLKDFRQKVLTQAVTGKLTEDWREGKELEEWKTEALGNDLIDVKYGTSKKSEYETIGTPILRIPNIKNGEIDISDLKFSILDDKEFDSLNLKEGDILIIRSNGSVSLVGQSAIIRKNLEGYAYAGYLIRLRVKKALFPDYLNYALESHSLREQIVETARSTSGVNNINSQEIKDLIISYPSIEEQQEIVRRVESLFAKADQIEASYQKLKVKIEQLPQALLAKAFRGELVEQLPTDGDAWELLEEIRKAKAGLEKGGRTKKMKGNDEVRMVAEDGVRYGK